MICERQDSAYEKIKQIVEQEYSGKDAELVSGAFFELLQFHKRDSLKYKRDVLKSLNNFSNLTDCGDMRVARTIERIRLRIEEIITSELQPA